MTFKGANFNRRAHALVVEYYLKLAQRVQILSERSASSFIGVNRVRPRNFKQTLQHETLFRNYRKWVFVF